ncbi:alpha/beta hydrolase [Bacteroidota bacterium]
MKMITNLITVAVMFITFIVIIGYYFQHLVIFFPEKLPKDYKYSFSGVFEERFFETDKHILINGLHFKADNPEGIILYLHGNAGSLKGWGEVAYDFLSFGYDVLIIDYRGFGKSSGRISEENMYHDAQFVYDQIKSLFHENQITVYGRSIGTGVASYIAAYNNPAKLILESPYVSLPDMAKKYYPWFPKKLIRFHFPNDKHLERITCPVFIIHGSHDEIIPVNSSNRLGEKLKPGDQLFIIDGGHHNDLSMFEEYQNKLIEILK